jgi:hypothetical protein
MWKAPTRRLVEVENRFALDPDLGTHEVVARLELRHANRCSRLPQSVGDAALHLADVSVYRHSVHVSDSVGRNRSRNCDASVSRVRTAQTWADFPEGQGRS